MPPQLTITWQRCVAGGLIGLLSLAFVDDGGWLGYSIGTLCAVLAVRGFTLGFSCDSERVVVRNLFLTRRVPLSAVESFGIRYSRARGGPTLCIEKHDGSRLNVTAFPITYIPSVATRRMTVVHQLNVWLEQQREPR